ncbi:Uncharacterised protein [Vibrio cholerae]|nr:Uncharacterised protein [Vibrio cholerae]
MASLRLCPYSRERCNRPLPCGFHRGNQTRQTQRLCRGICCCRHDSCWWRSRRFVGYQLAYLDKSVARCAVNLG